MSAVKCRVAAAVVAAAAAPYDVCCPATRLGCVHLHAEPACRRGGPQLAGC